MSWPKTAWVSPMKWKNTFRQALLEFYHLGFFMLFSTFKVDAKFWESLSRWISPLLSVPFSTSPSQHHSWKDMALFISGSSDEKIKTLSSHQLSGSNSGEGKAGVLNSRSYTTSHTVFGIRHLRFLCQLFCLWFMVSPFSRSIKSHSRAFGPPPSVHSTRHPQLPLREEDRQHGEYFCELCPRFSLIH